MLSVNVDTSAMEEALDEFARASRKDLQGMLRQQAGTLVGHVIALTPPAAGKGQAMAESGGVSLEAKKHGEGIIEADIKRIFVPMKAKDEALAAMVKGDGYRMKSGKRNVVVRDTALTLAKMKMVHKYARNPASGRTRTQGGLFMALSRAPLIAQFVRQQQQKVGILSAGWLAAADALKTAKRLTPAWITRHGRQPGGADIQESKDRTAIRVHNDQAWFPGDMSRRVQFALDRRERGLKKATEAILERRTEAARRRQDRRV